MRGPYIFWRSVFAVAATILLVIGWKLGTGHNERHGDKGQEGHRPQTTLGRGKRWITSKEQVEIHSEVNITHIYMTNSWYRYAKMLTESRNVSNCYVCSYMPVSSAHPNLEARPLPELKSECISEFCANSSVYLTGEYSVTGVMPRNSCSEPHPFTKLDSTALVAVYTHVKVKEKFTQCFVTDGS